MKISRNLKYLITILVIWALTNLLSNVLGMWITKLMEKSAFTYPEDAFNEFFAPILIQSALFAVFSGIGFLFFKTKNLTFFIYVVVQFIAFHIIFALNSGFHYNTMFFQSKYEDPGIIYLSYCGSYLIDILYFYFPIKGNFDNGKFMPSNIGTFYIHWFLLVLVYYFVITWISIMITRLFFRDKTKKKTKKKKVKVIPTTPDVEEQDV